ncbi:MAG: tripartite tricarboxylate transporter substrate binding protein [Burkholderiaceae bacterium]
MLSSSSSSSSSSSLAMAMAMARARALTRLSGNLGRAARALAFAVVTVAAATVSLAAGTAAAAWPDKPIRFIVPSAAGGSPDVIMRLLMNQMSTQMGVPIVVENKPGASYQIGTTEIARAAPDGYTLGYGNIVSLAINQALYTKVPYDVERDLTLVTNAVNVYNLLVVNKDLPVKTLPELITHLKRNPGKLVMASGGNGTTGHLGGELFKALTGTYMLHVPYRGSPQAIADLIAGEAQVIFDNSSSIAPHVTSGRVRALAVSASKRLPAFPDLPAIAEVVPGYETVAWGGIIGPAGLPPDVVKRLETEMKKALAAPAVMETLGKLQVGIDGSTSEQFRALVKREQPKWAEVIQRSGAKVD